MQKRATLHRSKLDEFKRWLLADGWTLGKLGNYQVVNAKKGKERFCAYDRNRGDHFTVQGNMLPVVGRFIRSGVEDRK